MRNDFLVWLEDKVAATTLRYEEVKTYGYTPMVQALGGATQHPLVSTVLF